MIGLGSAGSASGLSSDIGCAGVSLGRIVFKRLLHHGESKPEGAEAENAAGDEAQDPVAFTQAEHLCKAIESHRDAEEEPIPPAQAREAFVVANEENATEEHSAVDSKTAFTKTHLMSEKIECM